MSLSANFTRPADTTAYTSGDLVANSTTAGSVVPLSWAIGQIKSDVFIRRVRIKKSTTSTTNAQFRVHLYESSATCTNGDNAAWLTTHSNYLGSVDVTVDKAFSDASQGEGTPATGTEIFITNITANADKTIYGLIEARAAYTPGNAEVFTVILELYV